MGERNSQSPSFWDNTDRAPHWIQTYSGLKFDLLHPTMDMIRVSDIARALSRICRFTGHTKEFYSVAQHSVYVSRLLPEPLAMWGLLHDATEAYISDLASPIKKLFPDYKTLESSIEKVVAEKFGLVLPAPREVIDADLIVLAVEKRDMMGPEPCSWGRLPDPPPVEILYIDRGWAPDEACAIFIDRYIYLDQQRKDF